jgi:transposase-like protein
VLDKRTKKKLATDRSVSIRTITRTLDTVELSPKIHTPRPVVIVCDASFFGRTYGILVARDPVSKENLHIHELQTETKLEYSLLKKDLEDRGYTIQAIVLDGRRGIPSVFPQSHVQLCQFHQWKTMRKHLTTRPKLASHKALLLVAGQISKCTEKEMRRLLEDFEKTYSTDITESVIDPITNKKRYIHKKLRSAYFSMMRSLPYLYTCQKYPALKIPTTTNSLDGLFGSLKMFVNTHRGLRLDRRFKMICLYLKM